jgi:signal recognition particle subunit SEC65
VAYFDKALSRQIRRVPVSAAVEHPTVQELESACKRLNYVCKVLEARHSAAWWKDEGAVEVVNIKKKDALLALSKEIMKMRSKS